MIRLTHDTILPEEVINLVNNDGCGGVNVFIGTVRNQTKNSKVLSLEFEAYEQMAVKEIEKIIKSIRNQWDIFEIAVHHRLGEVAVGEVVVVIAVSSAHRAESFAACQYAIDTLKQTVPIWKKENSNPVRYGYQHTRSLIQ